MKHSVPTESVVFTLNGSLEESLACLAGGDSVVISTGRVSTHKAGPLAAVIFLLDQVLHTFIVISRPLHDYLVEGGGDGGGGALEGVRGCRSGDGGDAGHLQPVPHRAVVVLEYRARSGVQDTLHVHTPHFSRSKVHV